MSTQSITSPFFRAELNVKVSCQELLPRRLTLNPLEQRRFEVLSAMAALYDAHTVILNCTDPKNPCHYRDRPAYQEAAAKAQAAATAVAAIPAQERLACDPYDGALKQYTYLCHADEVSNAATAVIRCCKECPCDAYTYALLVHHLGLKMLAWVSVPMAQRLVYDPEDSFIHRYNEDVVNPAARFEPALRCAVSLQNTITRVQSYWETYHQNSEGFYIYIAKMQQRLATWQSFSAAERTPYDPKDTFSKKYNQYVHLINLQFTSTILNADFHTWNALANKLGKKPEPYIERQGALSRRIFLATVHHMRHLPLLHRLTFAIKQQPNSSLQRKYGQCNAMLRDLLQRAEAVKSEEFTLLLQEAQAAHTDEACDQLTEIIDTYPPEWVTEITQALTVDEVEHSLYSPEGLTHFGAYLQHCV